MPNSFKIFALSLTVALAAPVASAQESTTTVAPERAPLDVARIASLFELDVTAGDGDQPVAFPGTQSNRDEFASEIPVFVPDVLLSILSERAVPFAGTSQGFSNESSVASILFDGAGYFAALDFESFTMTVEGTNLLHGTPAELDAAASFPAADYYLPFAADYAGAVVQFGFAGVDYLVQFECKVGAAGEEGAAPCITEEEAEELISQFFVCSAEAQCLRRDPRDLTGPADQ